MTIRKFTTLLALCLLSAQLGAAELPPEIKPTADQYDRAMATYDRNVEARVTNARNTYRNLLTSARRTESSGKRLDAVAAIDADLAALEADALTATPPANLPMNPILTRHRDKCVNARELAEKAVESSRRFTRDNYLQWLGGMAAAANKGKSPSLEAAAKSEIERVRASMPDQSANPKTEE